MAAFSEGRIIIPGAERQYTGGLILPHSPRSEASARRHRSGEIIRPTEETNVTRLYAIWGAGLHYLNTLIVEWRFDDLMGLYYPDPADREPDAADDRVLYSYRPAPNSPFRRSGFAYKSWEVWSVTLPSEMVQESAEINIVRRDTELPFVIGAAIVRNGQCVCVDGPTASDAGCIYMRGMGGIAGTGRIYVL